VQREKKTKYKTKTHLNVTQETNEKTNQIHMKNKQPKKMLQREKTKIYQKFCIKEK